MDPFDHDLERGLANRRAILGDAWVDKSVANATAFSADFQNFITRYAWHEVWGRPGLEPKTRRVIVLAITCALGRWEEFELHLRASLTGGNAVGPQSEAALPLAAALPPGQPDTRLTPEEVKEVLMQAAIYAGVPAANTGMAIAAKLLRELGEAPPPLPATEACHTGVGRHHRSSGTPALHYTVRAPRDASAVRPTLVLSHALGTDLSLWDGLARSLAAEHRVVCYDHRGHGDSDVPAGPYTVSALAEDAAQLLAELEQRFGTGPVVWVGLSLGGMVGQELALRHPERLRALVLANTTAGYDTAGREHWSERVAAVEAGGIEAVADAVLQRWFTPAFLNARPAVSARWRRRLVTTPAAGYLGACHAVRQHDAAARLAGIEVPTLVVAGARDESTPVAMAEGLTQGIPEARLEVLEQAAHLSVIEQPAAFEAVLRRFLAGLG